MGLPNSLIAALLLAAFTSACGQGGPPPPDGPQQEEAAATEGLIVTVGDSLTAGLGVGEEQAWPALVERRLREEGFPWKVHNAGVSGETSSGASGRIEWILRLEPGIVVVETGANDGLRGVPPQVLRENLDAMVGTLKEAGVTVVLAGMRMVTNLGEDYLREFEKVYGDIAEEHEVILIPFLLEGVAGDQDLNQGDGIHPTAEGHRVISETAYPAVVEAIEKVRRQR